MEFIIKNIKKDLSKLFWLILLLFSTNFSIEAQTSLNDCSGAIEVCGNGAISSNATGVGQQEIGSNACSSMEHNSLWIKIEITKAGTLGFTLSPTSPNLEVDYDFFIFGPNASCGNLGEAIRCSTTNPLASNQADNLTGMNDQETETSEGPGVDGNSFVRSLDVLPGESYFIVIDRPIGQSPFELEWTGTSTVGGFPFPEGVEVNQPANLVKCGINGTADFNLFDTRDEITSQPQTEIKYFAQLAQAIDNTNELPPLYTSSLPNKTIYARVENLATGCSEIVDFNLIIPEGPAILPTVNYELCDLDNDGLAIFDLLSKKDELFNGLSASNHTLGFFATPEDAENDRKQISSALNTGGGTFYARVEETSGNGCFSISTLSLLLNSPVEMAGFSAKDLRIEIGSKEIKVPVFAGRDYAVNDPNGPYDPGPQLQDLPVGMNTLYVRNASSCEISSLEVLVPEFPPVFSPNNDRINDLWFVSTGNYPVEGHEVRIFDRYGKLLSQFFVNSGNWDGTFNGSELPADDYWFEFSLPENVILRGHFSLVK
ncbi:T9SS type B sorting domain-containing protein [Salinimicrobium oceani]|uniref:T9SS type B sorting domain-containing protein n=1 Tax=Salinimicrobium oceani TaxID=2722702 RepID=A0ABX1CZN9_9FLAO|nr:T9SS type B sorting domain-containing protein [Salinimicrobium oceani]NJW53721.1 T9SS type B sorting domain-containing protein [Salinimicrobium oceani]